ncbi:hypothetical protein, partial [Yersinia pestis]|uniref:hypothetical protein n=1 Tax=Yersinia pestis TaxID=632 RepID=UPI000AF9DE5C
PHVVILFLSALSLSSHSMTESPLTAFKKAGTIGLRTRSDEGDTGRWVVDTSSISHPIAPPFDRRVITRIRFSYRIRILCSLLRGD